MPDKVKTLRRSIAGLALLSLMVFMLASAHVCKVHQPLYSVNADGDYWGYTGTGGEDQDSTDNTVTATSRGAESCNFIFQTDWDKYTLNIGTDFSFPAVAGSLGGWNTDFGDCFLEHRIVWHATHTWTGIHGQSGSLGPIMDCWNLAQGNPNSIPCP